MSNIDFRVVKCESGQQMTIASYIISRIQGRPKDEILHLYDKWLKTDRGLYPEFDCVIFNYNRVLSIEIYSNNTMYKTYTYTEFIKMHPDFFNERYCRI